MRLRSACFLFLLLATPAAARAGAPSAVPPGAAEPGQLCRAGIAAAEREAGLPPRLLAAMARVESGRRDPEMGRFHPWPWTINAEGRGSFFPTKAAAIAAVQGLQAQGVRSIDVGCMQINLRHHPNAFATLEEAFDPTSNARYAARFLKDLQAARGDWMRSASHYHSQTPELADAYRARVAAALEAEQAVPSPVAPPPPAMLAAASVAAPSDAAGHGCAARVRVRRRLHAVEPDGARRGAARGDNQRRRRARARRLPDGAHPPRRARPGAGGAALTTARFHRIGQEYISPPSVQRRFSPRSKPIGVFGPRVRSNSSP